MAMCWIDYVIFILSLNRYLNNHFCSQSDPLSINEVNDLYLGLILKFLINQLNAVGCYFHAERFLLGRRFAFQISRRLSSDAVVGNDDVQKVIIRLRHFYVYCAALFAVH